MNTKIFCNYMTELNRTGLDRKIFRKKNKFMRKSILFIESNLHKIIIFTFSSLVLKEIALTSYRYLRHNNFWGLF